jgi:hypothetical protein
LSLYRVHGNMVGAYAIANVRIRNRVVLTNKTPTGLLRGFGGPRVYCPLERLMQRIAKNGAQSTATITLDPVGAVTAQVASVPQGQGHRAVLAEVVAGVFGITPSQVTSAGLIFVAANVGACGLGELSRPIGRRAAFLLMGAVRLVAFPLLFLAMGRTSDLGMLTLEAMPPTLVANGSYGPLLIFLNETFPTALRATGTGLSWNVGCALGGILPTFVSLAAAGPSEIPMALTIFTTGVILVYLLGAFTTKETRGNLDRFEARPPGRRAA